MQQPANQNPPKQLQYPDTPRSSVGCTYIRTRKRVCAANYSTTVHADSRRYGNTPCGACDWRFWGGGHLNNTHSCAARSHTKAPTKAVTCCSRLSAWSAYSSSATDNLRTTFSDARPISRSTQKKSTRPLDRSNKAETATKPGHNKINSTK